MHLKKIIKAEPVCAFACECCLSSFLCCFLSFQDACNDDVKTSFAMC